MWIGTRRYINIIVVYRIKSVISAIDPLCRDKKKPTLSPPQVVAYRFGSCPTQRWFRNQLDLSLAGDHLDLLYNGANRLRVASAATWMQITMNTSCNRFDQSSNIMFVYHTKSNFELLASLISASFCSFAVVMIGVAQIAPGVALNAVSGRVRPCPLDWQVQLPVD